MTRKNNCQRSAPALANIYHNVGILANFSAESSFRQLNSKSYYDTCRELRIYIYVHKHCGVAVFEAVANASLLLGDAYGWDIAL